MNPFLAAQLQTQYVPGVGYVEAGNPSVAVGALGDDSSIMMISGLGGVGAIDPTRPTGQSTGGGLMVRQWWDMLPWYVWVLIGIGVLSAGAYLFRNLKKAS